MGNPPRDVGNWGELLAREGGHMSEHAPSPAEPQGMSRLNPGALAVADAALLLSRLGGNPITEEMLRADINAGAPTNADGSINLVRYAAWLVKEIPSGGD